MRLYEDQTNSIFNDEKGVKIIYKENFQKELKNTFREYKKAIINGTPFNNIATGAELRENFIAKMIHICNNS